MSEVNRPSNWADATTDWELGKPPVFTNSKQATSDRESDNVSFVGCEEGEFTWCEDWQEIGQKPTDRPYLRSTVGIMSTCGPVVVDLTEDGTVIVCSWCTPAVHLVALNRTHRVSHSICRSCSDRILESLL